MTVYEYNYDSSYDNTFGDDVTNYIAQTFTIGAVGTNENFILDSVIVRLRKFGSPTGHIHVEINSVKDDGTPQTIGTIDSAIIDAGSLTTSFVNYTATFTGGKVLHPGTKYCIVLDHNGNSTNYIRYEESYSDVYIGGEAWYRWDYDWYSSNYDWYFAVNGHTTYNSYAISSPIDYNNGTITSATLYTEPTADYISNDDFYNFWMTADGTNWEQVVSGVAHTFTNTGTDLRWKAGGTTGSTLNGVEVYNYH